MAHILSVETKEVVYKTVKKLVGIKCDKCGKVILADNGEKSSNRYFEVSTGHRDWGNDSFESVHYYDLCPSCVTDFANEYLESAKGTAWIDIETCYAYPIDEEE